MGERFTQPRARRRDVFAPEDEEDRFGLLPEQDFDVDAFLPRLGQPAPSEEPEEEAPAELTEEERLKAALRERPPAEPLPPAAPAEDRFARPRARFEAARAPVAAARPAIEPPERLQPPTPSEFASLAEYEAARRARGRARATEAEGRPPGTGVTTRVLYSWTDPVTGTLQVTDDQTKVPPDVAADVFQHKPRAAREPREPVAAPAPAAPLEPLPAAAPAPQRPGELGEALRGLGEAARIGAQQPGAAALDETLRAREAEAAVAPTTTARQLADRKIQEIREEQPSTSGEFLQALIDRTGESDIAGKMTIPVSTETDLEANLNALPRNTFLQTMSAAWHKGGTDQPGVAGKALAMAESFGDLASLGGTQQLEFDYARKLALADPEVIEFALSQGISQKQLGELIFPEGEDYQLLSGFLQEGRGPVPFTRRTKLGFVQDHWRKAAEQNPELVNGIARKTRGALESGLAWEHFMEQGTLKGLGEGLATDPMFVLTLLAAAVSGGLTLSSSAATKAGALRTAATLQKASGLTSKARVVFEPLETAVVLGGKKVIGPVARVAKQPIRTAVGKAAPGIFPGAKFGIRRAAWRGWETKGGKGRRAVARLLTLFSDSDLVLAHKNQVIKGMNESLAKLGVPEEVLIREGARIEAAATAMQKAQKRKPLLFNKGQIDAERMLKGLKGKTLIGKDGKLTPLGRVVHWLDTGKGEAALTPAERKIADTLRTRFDALKAQLPEGVGKVEHYFPRFKPIGKKVTPVQTAEKALGKELESFWEEIRRAEKPAIRLYTSRDELVDGLAKRLAGQDVTAIDDAVNKGLRDLAESLDGAKPGKKIKGFEDLSAEVKAQRAKGLRAKVRDLRAEAAAGKPGEKLRGRAAFKAEVEALRARRKFLGTKIRNLQAEAAETPGRKLKGFKDLDAAVAAQRANNEKLKVAVRNLQAEAVGAAGVGKTKKKLKGLEVPKTVDISGKPVSLAEAKRIARIQRAKKTKAGLAAADRIEARIADIEAIPAKVISPARKKAAGPKIRELRPAVKQLEKQLGAADVEVRGLQKPVRRAERGKLRIARLAEQKKELQRGIRQTAKGTAKVKREEELSLIASRLEKAQAEAAALVPDEKAIQRHARELHKRAVARGQEFSLKEAVKDEFTGPIRIAKPKRPGAEMDAWKKLPLAWRAKVGEGRPLDTLMQEILDKNPGLRGEYGAIPDPIRFIEDLKAETAGKSRRRVSDFEQAAEEELLWGVEEQEAVVLSKIDNLTVDRESLLRQALEKQADETLEEAEKARWIAGFEKKIAKLDLEHAKIQTALPPARELEQLAKRLDISYKNREKLVKDLANKRRKMREYWDFTKAKKPIYVDKPVDVGTEFVEMMRKYPVVRTELEGLEQFHRKWILRPFKTTMLGYRPAYALRNMTTASARTINEMINGFMEGKAWAPSWNKTVRDYMHMDSEFLFESMYARHIPVTTKKAMGRIPHFVYTMEGTSDRFFKTGAAVGKVRGEVGRLARLNQVPTAGKAFPEIVEQLQAKGVITDFADLVRKEGVDEANRIFFNFQERIGLMIGVPGEAFPFAEWGYKNFSYVLRDLTKHPWKMRAWKIGYDQWAHQYQDHPEYSRHLVRLLKDSPLKYFNNWFMQPLWSVGGYQPLRPFLEGTTEYDRRRGETFEPALDRVLAREKAENLTWDERERLIDRESSALLNRGVGSFRHYLDQNYIAGPQTGYRRNKTALKEIIDYVGQNLSLGPTAQMALGRVGLAKYQGGNRQWLGWQNVVEDLGLAISGTNLLNLAGENRGRFYERKVRQEMDRQQIRGEVRNLREAEKAVGIQNAIIHTANNLLPISARFIPPEEVERVASAEVRQRAATGGLPISETPPPDVMKRQFETGEDYPVAKFGVEATRAVKKADYSRVREVSSPSGGVAALVPLRLSTPSEEIEAKRVGAAVDAIGSLPEGERSAAADAYGVGAMILADTAAPARKRVESGYYDRAAAFVAAPDTERRKATDPELVELPLGVTGIGNEKTYQLAKKYIERLAADAISTGDRELFERVLAEHPEIVELAGRLEPDLVTKQRVLVMKGARLAPQKTRANVKKVADLARGGMSAELISFTDSLSSSEVTAIKDEIGVGRYKELLDDAKEIGKFNEASELLQGVFASEDVARAWNDLNNKQKLQIDHSFPELDMPERIVENKKQEEERKESEDWKGRIADSNYDVRMRRVIPADVKRRLGNEHQFWFDFFNPSERELAQKERVKVLKAERKEQEKRLKKEKEFRAEVEDWRKQIEESEFDNSFRGSRVPMKVKRRLAEKNKKFEDFFFKSTTAAGGSGRRAQSQATAKARAGISAGARFRPAETRAERRRRTQVPLARGTGGTGGFGEASGQAGKKT